jgi:hypothetical protein
MKFDFIKWLFESPNKIKRLFILCCRVILNLTVARWLYIHEFGSYNLQFKEWQAWHEFISAGPAVLWTVAYLISEVVLFRLAPIFSFLLLHSLSRRTLKKRKIDKASGSFFMKYFSFLEIINVDEKTNRISADAQTREVCNLMKQFAADDAPSEISRFKTSLIKNIWDNYIAFIIVYFFFLPYHSHTPGLNLTIILGAVLFLFLYVNACWVLDILQKGAGEILFHLERLLIEKLVGDVFKGAGYAVLSNWDDKTRKQADYVFMQGRRYVIAVHFSQRPIPEFVIKRYVEQKESNTRYLIFTNRDLPDSVRAMEVNSPYIKITNFSKERDLAKKIKAIIKDCEIGSHGAESANR